jgi:cytochrome c
VAGSVRPAGSVPGFDHTAAMKRSTILAGPLKRVPGTSMTCEGVTDPKDRSDLIVHLKRANDSSECRPKLAAPG